MKYEQVTLHVGVPRTGTSTIQSFLELNRKRLDKQGIFYVAPWSLATYPMDRDCCDEGRLLTGLQEIGELSRKCRTKSVLWSNEWLSGYAFVRDAWLPGVIRRAMSAKNYRVIIYLRRQDHRLRSGYLQSGIKCKEPPGPVLDFEDWLQWSLGENHNDLLKANIDYAGLIQPWIDVFGRENVVIRVFEKGQLLNDDLLQDFCDAAQLHTDNFNFEVPNRNVSFNMELYDMLGMYNSVFQDASYSNKLNQFIEILGEDEFFAEKFFTRFNISPKSRINILQRCEETNRKVARELLGREDGVLFRERWPSPDDPYQPYGGLTIEKLVPIFMHIVKRQNECLLDLNKRLEAVESQVSLVNIYLAIRHTLGKIKRRILGITLPEKTEDNPWESYEPQRHEVASVLLPIRHPTAVAHERRIDRICA